MMTLKMNCDEVYEYTIKRGLTKEDADLIVSGFKRTIYTKLSVTKDNKEC